MLESPWPEAKVLGSMALENAADKLLELGEVDLANALKNAPREARYRRGGEWRWPFRTKAWQHTAHAFGYIAPLSVTTGFREIVDVASIEPDLSLKRNRLRVTLDALRVEEYPGSGTHHILIDFYAQNQVRPAPEHLHFNATYRVRQGQRAAIRGYPIFLGINCGADGLAFRCLTVNVKNENDQALLDFLESDTLKSGLRLAATAQPAIAPLADLARNLTKGLVNRNRNVPVQDVFLGLDFSDSATGARLRLGSYIAAQIPDDEIIFRWSDWALDLESRSIVSVKDRNASLPYNYFVFAITKYEGN